MPSLGRCGPYELIRWVAAGGMGEIFLAQGPRPDGSAGLAAVKRLLPQAARDPVFVDMFLDEGRLARRLDHPNVCSMWDLGLDEGQYYLAMEWIDGVSLELLLRRAAGRGGIPVPIAVKIAAEVADGLDYAHRLADVDGSHMGIVHRDVSPPNIMIGFDGRVRLLDFGLAKARTQLAKTQPGFVKGKFGYVAPEQLTGKVDYRTDVFALGLCLYEALTGRQVFGEATTADTVVAVRGYREAPSARALRPEVPAELDALVQKAIAPRPSQRFESAGEMKLYLRRAMEKAGQTVNATQIATFVGTLFPEHESAGALPTSEFVDARLLAAAAVDQDDEDDEGGRPWLVTLLVAVGLAAAGAAAWLLLT